MRRFLVFFFLLTTGCGGSQTDSVSNQGRRESKENAKETTDSNKAVGRVTSSPQPRSPEKKKSVLQNSISTVGSDWPRFLGPLGTSISEEKGIIAPWPASGLRLVWQKAMGTGYG